MADILLFVLCFICIVYCCDIPALQGFDIFINNHNSIYYSVGVSIIAAYIFYIFQVIIPRYLRFRQVKHIVCSKLYDIENLMIKELCLLQGELNKPVEKTSKESVKNYLDQVNIFKENSRYEIQNHKELSLFEAIEYYDIKIISLVDEILSNQYLRTRHEKILLKLKLSKFHSVVIQWHDNLPGEYEHYNTDSKGEKKKGYIYVNNDVVNSDFASSIDEYLAIYNQIHKLKEKLYR